MILTQRQLDVLNDVVIDGQAWADHAESHQGITKGTASMLSKVKTWEGEYDQHISAGSYKNRAAREKEIEDALVPTALQLWEDSMKKTDRKMPRHMEDLITSNASLVIPAEMKKRYDDKIKIRAEKP
jgi:hypothetical protein